jgi:hypoxanthine-guanine phosphoribosyltransferase
MIRNTKCDSPVCYLPDLTNHRVTPGYVGSDVDVRWYAGYGIDCAERWRSRPEIREVRTPAARI